MKDVIYVFGHKNPDSDSICASLAYAEFKNKTGSIPAVPARLGKVSRETNFILNYFGVEKPELIETVKTQVSDLDIDRIKPVSPDVSLMVAWNMMKNNGIKTLPVVDEHNKLIGVVTLTNITSAYMDIWDNFILSKSNTKLENIIDTLAGKYEFFPDFEPNFSGKILTVAMQPESIIDVIEAGDIVICGDREDSQETILEKGASLMIVTGNLPISDSIVTKAKDNKCVIISSPYDTFTASRLITQSIPVSYVMQAENLVYFKEVDFVEDITERMTKTRYRSYPVVDINNSVIGTVSRYHLISRRKKKIIMVDHNEKDQSVDGIEDAEIMEIIDHHRVAAVQTGNPIYFRNQPVGSTSTIVASIFFENGVRPSRKAAGVLCGAIISDTLLLSSPTTTPTDRLVLKRLADIAGIDVESFAKEMFIAGTSLKGRTVEQIFNTDFKQFDIGSFKVGVSQVGTMDIDGFMPMKDEMMTLMNNTVNKERYDLLILMLTDIINNSSILLLAGEHKELVAKAYNIEISSDTISLPGVVSRKKQVIPPLTAAVS